MSDVRCKMDDVLFFLNTNDTNDTNSKMADV